MDDDELRRQKDLAFHSAVLDAWVQAKNQRDKTLLGLSSAGIALLVSLLTTTGPGSDAELIAYTIAGLSFAITIFIALYIMTRNPTHLEDVLREEDPNVEVEDVGLGRADRAIGWTFGVAAVATLVVAFLAGINQLEEKDMSKKRDSVRPSSSTSVQKSLNGIGRLRPQASQDSGSSSAGSGSGSGGKNTGQGNTSESTSNKG